MPESFPCPHCGEPVPAGAGFCRECGSDDLTGWGPDAEAGGLDLPAPMADDEYDAFLAQEFGAGPAARSPARKHLARAGVLLVILAFLLFMVLR